jgi:Protein of unknown function (DUF3237)
LGEIGTNRSGIRQGEVSGRSNDETPLPACAHLPRGVRILQSSMRAMPLREARGGLVQVVSQGFRHGPPDVMDRLARGEDVDPADYFFRTVMRFETGAAELAWLNKTIAVATAARKARRVELRAWRLL